MVTVILREARVFDLLLRNEITRMPVVPTANYDDHPEMIEVSSSDDDGDEVEEPDDDPTSPPARGSRMDQTSGETDAGGDDIGMKRTWGANLPRQRNAGRRYETSVISSRR